VTLESQADIQFPVSEAYLPRLKLNHYFNPNQFVLEIVKK
jgi:hypothetical protein